MPLHDDTPSSPSRLPPALVIPESRPYTPSKSTPADSRSHSSSSTLAPLQSPTAPPAPAMRKIHKDMPAPSAALLAGRWVSPPTSPQTRDMESSRTLVQYALGIHYHQQRQQQRNNHANVPKSLQTAAAAAHRSSTTTTTNSKGTKGVVVVSLAVTAASKRTAATTSVLPKLLHPSASTTTTTTTTNNNNNNTSTTTTNALDQQPQKNKTTKNKTTPKKKKKKKTKPTNRGDDHDDDTGLNAGVFMLHNRKTGHCFVGTTWDLRHAAAQNFADLEAGVHVHKALVSSVQTYGRDASGIQFRILERVAPPVESSSVVAEVATTSPHRRRRTKNKTAGTFDVRAMETLLHRRCVHHQKLLIRKSALRLVQRRLVVPVLAQFWPRWKNVLVEQQRELEHFAAAVAIQSVLRMVLAKRNVLCRRRHRAAVQITKFLAVCATNRMLHKRRSRQQRHTSATQIQLCMRHYLSHRKRHALAISIRKWLCARHIQRVFRAFQSRRVVHTMRAAITQQRAAQRIQSLVRGFLTRLQITQQRHRSHTHGAATCLQAWWRGVFTRRVVYGTQRESRRRDVAVRVLQAFYRRVVATHTLARAAQSVAFQSLQATRIHAAYRNYLAKKFGWAALSVQLETRSATRVQHAMRRWFFFKRVAQLATHHRRDSAARALQRTWRAHCARRAAHDKRTARRRTQAATRLQRAWRGYSGNRKLHLALVGWRVDRSARRIQACYRGFHQRRVYAIVRAQRQRERAATKLQSAFRMRLARREWQRRVALTRAGAVVCQHCHDALATVVSWRLGLELCSCCGDRVATDANDDSLVALSVFRHQQRLAVDVQRVFRGFQSRMSRRVGVCGLCETRAVRVKCRTCRKTFCLSCDALLHKPFGSSTTPRHERLRIEVALRQDRAALVLQKHTRRYAQRHTIHTLRLRVHTHAAVVIQTKYKSRRQRRHTHALVVARQELLVRQHHAAARIQHCIRGLLARRYVQQLRKREHSAVRIQKLLRGAHGRRRAAQRRRERDAAVSIQRHVRGCHGRRVAIEKRRDWQQRRRQRAALVVQRHVRGWRVRSRMRYKKQVQMAVRIQLAWRRNRARRVVAALIRERDKRRRLESYTQEQARLAQQQHRERAAATKIQSLLRRCLAQHELQMRRLRRASSRRREQLLVWQRVERTSAVRIQRFVRRQWLTRAMRASLVIQRGARLWLARRQLTTLRRTKKAAVCIQRAFRYARVKRRLARLVSMESTAVAGAVHGWVELFDEESACVYYYNRETLASQWIKPPELMGDSASAAAGAMVSGHPSAYESEYGYGYDEHAGDAPPEWVEYWDENVGASYYYNTLTGEATWATPALATAMPSSTTNQWDDPNAWWPPGAPVPVGGGGSETTKTKTDGGRVAATEVSNQAEAETTWSEQQPVVGDEWDGSEYANQNDGGGGGYYQEGNGGYAVQATVSGEQDFQSGQAVEDDTPMDTTYDLNYQIYMTQLQQQQHDPEQGKDHDQ